MQASQQYSSTNPLHVRRYGKYGMNEQPLPQTHSMGRQYDMGRPVYVPHQQPMGGRFAMKSGSKAEQRKQRPPTTKPWPCKFDDDVREDAGYNEDSKDAFAPKDYDMKEEEEEEEEVSQASERKEEEEEPVQQRDQEEHHNLFARNLFDNPSAHKNQEAPFGKAMEVEQQFEEEDEDDEQEEDKQQQEPKGNQFKSTETNFYQAFQSASSIFNQVWGTPKSDIGNVWAPQQDRTEAAHVTESIFSRDDPPFDPNAVLDSEEDEHDKGQSIFSGAFHTKSVLAELRQSSKRFDPALDEDLRSRRQIYEGVDEAAEDENKDSSFEAKARQFDTILGQDEADEGEPEGKPARNPWLA